ncbi:MAG: Uma2 family endonuclease [Chloroflexi bacterium]|nr:Uma2 family endonuclease [Chloroflexota bacterium]
MAVEVTRRLFTVDEYYRMAAAGILHEDDRVELIEGEIVQMTAIGARHAAAVTRLNWAFISALGQRATVSPQNPLRLSQRSEPQPDVLLLKPRDDFYAAGHPGPADVLLLVEVMDSSAGYDRAVKLPLYARHGIPEVWLVDLEQERVEVYREPSAEGYRSSMTLRRGERQAPAAFPALALAVEDILGA